MKLDSTTAAAEIKAGRAIAHELWAILTNPGDRDGFGLRPEVWEGPGQYQHVSRVGETLGVFVYCPKGESFKMPTPPKKKALNMVRIEFSTDNDAFQGRKGAEIARTLRELANRFADGDEPTKVMDANGNSIGTVEWSDD